jgi:hypothetical protein
MKDWAEFENLVAEIQTELAPDAIVTRKHFITGTTGIRREFDVTISYKVSLYPLLIVIECKYYKRPVGVEKVEAFITKLRDVGVNQGVMISNAGFTEGARRVAKQNFITLQTYNEATETDWKSYLSKQWYKFIAFSIEELQVYVFANDGVGFEVKLQEPLFDSNGDSIQTVDEIARWIIQASPVNNMLGRFYLIQPLSLPIFFRTKNHLEAVGNIAIQGVNRAWEIVLNLALANGYFLEDELTQERVFSSYLSQDIHWNEIFEATKKRELTIDEYEMLKSDEYQLLPISQADPLKLIFTQIREIQKS